MLLHNLRIIRKRLKLVFNTHIFTIWYNFRVLPHYPFPKGIILKKNLLSLIVISSCTSLMVGWPDTASENQITPISSVPNTALGMAQLERMSQMEQSEPTSNSYIKRIATCEPCRRCIGATCARCCYCIGGCCDCIGDCCQCAGECCARATCATAEIVCVVIQCALLPITIPCSICLKWCE